jgi:hypothetical protein
MNELCARRQGYQEGQDGGNPRLNEGTPLTEARGATRASR